MDEGGGDLLRHIHPTKLVLEMKFSSKKFCFHIQKFRVDRISHYSLDLRNTKKPETLRIARFANKSPVSDDNDKILSGNHKFAGHNLIARSPATVHNLCITLVLNILIWDHRLHFSGDIQPIYTLTSQR